jgi:hypothetical protein
VLAVLHPVLPHGATGIGSEVLEGGRVGRRSVDDDGVLESTVLFESGNDLGNRGRLLTDRHVDALDGLVGSPVLALVDDRVDRDRRLTRLTVADDQLTLTTTDRDHSVDRLDTCLHRLAHRLASGDAGGLDLERTTRVALDRALPVDRVTQCIDDTTEHAVANGNGEDLARTLNRLTLFDLAVLAEDDGADLVLFEVHGKTNDSALELEHLVGHDPRKPGDTSDTVSNLPHDAYLLALDGRLEVLYVLAEYGGDLLRVDSYVSHLSTCSSLDLLVARDGA